MNIQSISKIDKEVVVSLSSDELVKLCNILYHASGEDKKGSYDQLHSEMIIARDLCQYGHIDNYCLSRIVKCRGIEKIQEQLKGESK